MKTHLIAAALGVSFCLAPSRALEAADAPPAPPAVPQLRAAQPAAATQGPVIAQVGTVQVTLDQLQRPLVEGYGLNILLNLIQLQVARDNVQRGGLTLTADDVKNEREHTIEKMFEESNAKLTDKMNGLIAKGQTAEADKIREQIRKDNAQGFEQFLQNQRITRAEFDIVTETNANLRKIAEPMLAGKINDENLLQAFKALYGETIKVRHIQCSNLQEVQEAKQRLDAGEPFADVATKMSRNAATARLGGEIPTPFSREMQGLPEAFKRAAFALKEGEVSDVVEADGAYHLIKLDKRIEPKAVKFEDVKESIRADLTARGVEATVKSLRQELANQAVKNLVITDPIMKEQWQQRLNKQQQASIKDKKEMSEQMKRERDRSTTQPIDRAPDLSPLK